MGDSSSVVYTFHGNDAIVSDKMRTEAQTAENVIAVFSFTETPVFERSSENNHSAGLANDVDGLLGDARNNPRNRSSMVVCVSAMVRESPPKIRNGFHTAYELTEKIY